MILNSLAIKDHDEMMLEYGYERLPEMLKTFTDIIATAIYRIGGYDCSSVFGGSKEKSGKSIVSSFKLGNKIIDIVG